jgi:hypothetical protein
MFGIKHYERWKSDDLTKLLFEIRGLYQEQVIMVELPNKFQFAIIS